MNKPQCLTAAQCLKELARVMEQFGIDNPITASKSKYVRYAHECWSNMPVFSTPSDWSFAIAEVGGKPVFWDSILFNSAYPTGLTGENIHLYSTVGFSSFSWNPPKPRTIMVELLVEDAEHLTFLYVNRLSETAKRIDIACRQALEREGVK